MLPRVVIVGGGFGGLSAAIALRGAPVSVTLIDRRNYHLFRPMLYQVATGLLSGDEISSPLRSMMVLISAEVRSITWSRESRSRVVAPRIARRRSGIGG